jgi:hypothetical protein
MKHALEFVVSNLRGRDPDSCQHFGTCLDHHRRATQIVLHGLGVSVQAQIVVENRLVNKVGLACQLSSGSGEESARWKLKLGCVFASS